MGRCGRSLFVSPGARGPLSSLDPGNGLTEAHVHDQRYLPDRITVSPTAGMFGAVSR